jgi:serine phosphatase RsbU (regulator of sigma subunit)
VTRTEEQAATQTARVDAVATASPTAKGPRPTSRFAGARPGVVGLVVLVTSLVLTGALSWISYDVNQRTEHRLLRLQVTQTATVLQAIVPAVETPLASAAQISATSQGSAADFSSYIASYVGASPKPFVSASLWKLVPDGRPQLVGMVGRSPVLASTSPRLQTLLGAAAGQKSVLIAGPLAPTSPRPRLGYAYAARTYVVYAESLLPAHRRVAVERGSPFSDLRFALYLGPKPTASAMLETNVDQLPVPGDTATATVPFGASSLTLVAGSTGQLGGTLSSALWWIVAVAGTALSLVAMLVAERLVRRRRAAERLTATISDLLDEERGIARTLQHALLPQALPVVPGIQAKARYVAGAAGVDIGGDWYDLLPLEDGRAFFVIGDVSGRGVAAGTTMAALRFAVHALVNEKHSPAVVLDRLVGLLDVARDGQFATILCGVLDIAGHEITIANAGHPPLLVIGDGGSRYVSGVTGPPVGVIPQRPYEETTVQLPPHAIVLAFTDGLIERPGEALDVSLEQLRSRAGSAAPLDDIFDRVMAPGLEAESSDDIAILGVQWLT